MAAEVVFDYPTSTSTIVRQQNYFDIWGRLTETEPFTSFTVSQIQYRDMLTSPWRTLADPGSYSQVITTPAQQTNRTWAFQIYSLPSHMQYRIQVSADNNGSLIDATYSDPFSLQAMKIAEEEK